MRPIMYKTHSNHIWKRVFIFTLILSARIPFLWCFQHNYKNMTTSLFTMPFMHSVFTSPASDSTAYVTVYTRIPNDILSFFQQDTLFYAKFELTIAIKNNKGEIVKNNILQESISASSFEDTNSKTTYTKNQITFLLKPGNYKLIINMLDISTRKPLLIKESIIVPSYFSKNLVSTDIRFYTKTQKNKSIV